MEKINFKGFDFNQTVNEQMPNIENYAKYKAQVHFESAEQLFQKYVLKGNVSNNAVLSIYQLYDTLKLLQKEENFRQTIAKMPFIGQKYAESRVYNGDIATVKFMIDMMSNLKINILTRADFAKVEENFDFYYKTFLKENYIQESITKFNSLKGKQVDEEQELE